MPSNPSIYSSSKGGVCPYPTSDFDSIVIGIPPQSPISTINHPPTGCSSEFIMNFHHQHQHNHKSVNRGANQRYGNMDIDEIENSFFDDLSSGTSSINPSPRVNQPSDSKLSYRVVIEPESPICLHQIDTPLIEKESNPQPFCDTELTHHSQFSLEQFQDKLIKDMLKDEFKVPILENTVNIDNVNNKPKRPTLKQSNTSKTNESKNIERNQRINFNKTLSKRSGSAPLARSKISTTPEPQANNIIRNLERAMDTLYSNQKKIEFPISGSTEPFFNISFTNVEQVMENRNRKKPNLKILIDNSNNIEYVRDRKKVKYEGMKTYNSNKKNIDSPPYTPPRRVDSEKLISNPNLTVWDKLKLGTANLKKRIESMKSSLQRCGSQLRVEKILGGALSSNNLLVASTSSSKLVPPTIEYRRSSTKKDLTKQKGVSPDLFNENSILCKMFNLLSEINTKDKVKVRWTLKKKYKIMIAQEKARKKEANLKGIYEHRKRLTRFQLQAVLNTVHPARIAPEIEVQIPNTSKSKNSLTNNSNLRSISPNLIDNSSRNSSNFIEYHEKNKEDILKQLNIIENLNNTLFSNDISRKVKFGDQKSNKNDPSQKTVSNSELQETQQSKISRPQSAPTKKQSEPVQPKKWNLQDVMIEKELTKQKKNIPRPKKSLYALATTFSETKLKLFSPYSPNVKENSENYSQNDQSRKNKSKGNSLVTEFQKMVLEDNNSSSGMNRSAISEMDEAPREMYDFSTVNPFDAVKNLNLTKQPTSMSEMMSINSTNMSNSQQEEAHHKEENAHKRKPKLKAPLDTGLRKVKKDAKVALGLVCTTERISVSVFQKITDKVNEQRNTLQKVQQRAAVAKKAVEWVQKERKNEATRVLSSSHYPDKDISNVEYSPTFAARDRIGIQQMEFHKFNPGPNNILFNHKLYNPIEHFEKSPTRQNKQSHNKIPKKLDEGVGKLPFKNVQSVSELLCFNTNMNVYHKYHGADPLQANYHTTMMMMAMEGTTNKNDKNHDFASANNLYIDPAPPSLSKDSIYDMNWGSSSSQEQNIKAFAPTRRELPMFEFPSNLGLPNIVDTAQWDLSLDNMPSIAPSSLPSLDLGNNNSNTTSLNTTNTLPSSTDPTSTIPSVSTNVPPPPVTSVGAVPPPPVTMGNVPPPPVMSSGTIPPITSMGVPQPPSVPIVTSISEGTGDNTDENENTESGGGDRGDLLASIRNFSKNKLKQANKIRDKESSKEVSAPQKASGGGDMMTDLFRKIGLRRNAIEGSKDEKKPKKKKKEKKSEEPIPPVPTPNSTPTDSSTAPDSSAATELPKMPPPKRPQSEDESDGSDVDSW